MMSINFYDSSGLFSACVILKLFSKEVFFPKKLNYVFSFLGCFLYCTSPWISVVYITDLFQDLQTLDSRQSCIRLKTYININPFKVSDPPLFRAGVNNCEYFLCFKRYGHTSRTRNFQNQSNFRSEKFSNARGRMRALYLTSYFKDFEKHHFFMFFGSL